MGTDKAVLPFEGQPLLLHLAKVLASVVADPRLLAPAGRYEQFGLPGLEDRRMGCGPLAGIETALLDSDCEWNLILACDMPFVTAEWLTTMIEVALASEATVRCICTGENPLLALWRRSALSEVQGALDAGNFRLRDLLEPLNAKKLIPPDPQILANWNRPEDLPGYPSEGKANFER